MIFDLSLITTCANNLRMWSRNLKNRLTFHRSVGYILNQVKIRYRLEKLEKQLGKFEKLEKHVKLEKLRKLKLYQLELALKKSMNHNFLLKSEQNYKSKTILKQFSTSLIYRIFHPTSWRKRRKKINLARIKALKFLDLIWNRVVRGLIIMAAIFKGKKTVECRVDSNLYTSICRTRDSGIVGSPFSML